MIYKKTELEQRFLISHMISFHYFEYVQNFYGKEEAHDFWEFVYVDSGEICALADGVQVLLHSGEGYLHRPWEKHNILTKGIFSSVIIFSFAGSGDMLNDLAGKRLTLYEEEQKELVKILKYGQEFIRPPYDDFDQDKIIWKTEEAFPGSQLLKDQMEIFFLTLLYQGQKQENRDKIQGTLQESKEEENLMWMIQVLSSHINDSVTLEEIAREAAYSVSYMEKLFHKKLNTTVKDYYHRLKIEQAKKWICEGNITFTEMAEQLGYGTIHNFSRVFKKYTKYSPTTYQKTIKSRGLL